MYEVLNKTDTICTNLQYIRKVRAIKFTCSVSDHWTPDYCLKSSIEFQIFVLLYMISSDHTEGWGFPGGSDG